MSYFPVSKSLPHTTHLSQFIDAQYFPGMAVTCSIIKSGVNDTYLVTTPTGKAIFRLYALHWRTPAQIAEELRFVLMLQSAGISVSYPIADVAAQYIQSLPMPEGDRYGVLFSYAQGDKVHNFSEQQHYHAGVLMARMHLLSHNYSLARDTYNEDTVLLQPLNVLSGFLGADTDELKFMNAAQQYLLKEWGSVNPATLRVGAVHLDLWFDNMNVHENGNITIFDFDFCGNGWLCLDIAYYILQLHYVERDETICNTKLAAFLSGYESVTPIPPSERTILSMLGVSLYYFYLGVQCSRFDNWSNSFLSETYLKRFISQILKRYFDLQKLGPLPDSNT